MIQFPMLKSLLLSCALILYSGTAFTKTTEIDNASCWITFSPRAGATEAIVEQIDLAKNSIYVMAYNYTSVPIGEAIRRANERGVKVSIIVDRVSPNQRGSQAYLDHEVGVTVYVDTKHRIMHNKVMIIDNFVFITGSFNFTGNAENVNAENVIVCHSNVGAQTYLEEWHRIQKTAKPLPPKIL